MKSLLKRVLLGASVGLLTLIAPSVIFAGLVSITPAPLVRPAFAGTDSQTFIEYQVQNTSGQALTGVSYRVGPNAFLDTTMLTTCGSTLAAGVTCIVALVYKAPGTKAQGTGEAPVPLNVCVNGRMCEGPTSGNTVKLRVVPALKKAYVLSAATTVSLLDTRTNAVVGTITLPAGTANANVLSPDLKRLYVSSTGPSAIYVVNTTNNAVIATITPTIAPASLAISPDGTRLYASVSGGGTATNIINTATNAIAATPTITWPGGGSAAGIVISPNGARLLTMDHISGALYSANTLTGTVATIVTLAGTDDTVSLSRDGRFAYVTQPNTSSSIDKVTLATGGVTVITSSLPASSNIFVTTSIDGRFLYLANNTGVIGLFDNTTNTQVGTVTTGIAGAFNLQFTPDQTKIYVLNGGASSTIGIIKNNAFIGTVSLGGAFAINSTLSPFIG